VRMEESASRMPCSSSTIRMEFGMKIYRHPMRGETGGDATSAIGSCRMNLEPIG